MNAFQILEQILEAIADGRKPSETVAQFRDRKADELQQHFDDKARVAQQEERVAHKQAIKAKKEYEQNPSSETGQNMANTAIKALDKSMATTSAERKADKIKQIKGKIDWRKSMSEALDIMEEIINEVSTKLWKKAAANSLDKREETAKNTAKTAEQSWDEYEEGSRKSPEDETALYRRAWKNDLLAKKAEDREEHAHDVLAVNSNAKSANKAIKAAKKVANKREDAFGANPSAKALNRSNKASKLVYADPKYKNEALSLMEQICDFADNLFELDYEEKQNISPNKITKVKKDKNGEKVEVVSVADELFPYSGSAKEQFNQKVLAKINDMIEGTGSLEDLIQFVRKGVATKKGVNEGFEEAIAVLEEILNPNEPKKERKSNKQQVYRRMDDPEKGKIGVKKNYNRVIHNDSANKDSAFDYVKIKGTKYRVDKYGEIGAPIQEEKKEPNKECEYRKGEWEKAVQNYYDTKKKNMDFEGQHPETKKAYDEERKAYANLDKARRDSKKINGPYEAYEKAISLIEAFIEEARDKFQPSPLARELRGKEATYNKHVADEEKYVNREANSTGYRAQVNRERAEDAERKAETAHKDLRKSKSEVLDGLRKRGATNSQAHEIVSRMIGEAFDLMEEIVNELDYNFVSKQKANAEKTLAKKEEEALNKEGKEKEEALDDIAKYQHKINTTLGHVENKRIKEIKAEEEKKNNKKSK